MIRTLLRGKLHRPGRPPGEKWEAAMGPTPPAPSPREMAHPSAPAARAVLVGIAVNALLAVAKGTAGVLGHSYALVADAIESAADVLTSGIVVWGLRVAGRPPDANHPYGHGKAETLAALAVSLAMLGAAAAIAVESVREILTPHHAPAPFTLLVLVLVVGTKELLFRRMARAGSELGSHALHSDAWHHRSDALTSLAAFLGITVALVGGPGWEPADDWAALVAAGIIAANALRLLRPALHELSDGSPDPALEARIRSTAAAVEGVRALEKCRVRKLGFDYYVDLHVEVDGSLSVREGHEIAHSVQDAVLAACRGVRGVLVHVEPAPG